MKKILCLIIILALSLTIVNAFAEDQPLSLSIEEVQQQAVKANKQIGLDDLNITTMQSSLNKANEDAKWVGDSYGAEEVLRSRIIKEVNTMEAATNLETANKNKVKDLADIKLDAYKKALNLVILNKEIVKENQILEVLKEKQKITQAKLKSGKITENDLIDADYDVDNKQNDIAGINEQIKNSLLQLKNVLNLSLDESPIKIKDDLIYQPIDKFDLQKFIEEAKSSSIDIYQAQEKIKAETKRMELTAIYFKQGNVTYDTNSLSLESAKLDLESANKALDVSIRNKYNDLLNQNEKVQSADRYLKLCNKKLANLQTKFKKGLISNEAVLDGRRASIEAEYQKYLAVYEYCIQKAEFLNLAGK